MLDQSLHTPSTLPCIAGVVALRSVVRAHVRDGPLGAPDQIWRAPARVMCQDARARGLRVEELIISLKRMWPHVADGERLPRDESPRLLARVVTLCVEEYYGSSG
jgi:hypothetical protein